MDQQRERALVALYPFEYFDLMSRRWMRARHVCVFEEIAVRYPAFKITGAPEVREVGESSSLTAGHLTRSPGSS